MNERVRVCDLDTLGEGEIAYVEIDGHPVAYARVGDRVFAIDDTCTHAHVSLSDGIVDEDDLTIECPKHGAIFSLETGEALTLPAFIAVGLHTAEVEAGEVYVSLKPEDEA